METFLVLGLRDSLSRKKQIQRLLLPEEELVIIFCVREQFPRSFIRLCHGMDPPDRAMIIYMYYTIKQGRGNPPA